MISRRKLLAATSVAATATLWNTSQAPAAYASGVAPKLRLVNGSGHSTAFAYVTANVFSGTKFEGHGLLNPRTGKLDPLPNPAKDGLELDAFLADHRLPFDTNLTLLQRLVTGRVWFSLGTSLKLKANRNPEGSAGVLVQPDPGVAEDDSYGLSWDYCELTYDARGLTANVSFVDAVAIPMSLKLVPGSGVTQTVAGMPARGTATLANMLAGQGGDWGACPVYSANGKLVRVVSPAKIPGLGKTVFAGYYSSYVQKVWDHYRDSGPNSVAITLGDVWPGKIVRGRTSGNKFTFQGITDGSYTDNPIWRPGTYIPPGSTVPNTAEKDIFGCDGALHGVNGTQQGRIAAVLGAAFCRGTLLSNAAQPDATATHFYTQAPKHHYARLVHEIAGRGYAFPYDDVTPTLGGDLSGTVGYYEQPDNWALTVTLKPPV
ncbi:beta-1,3-glucanase family protein [Streptomyces sp. NPDC085932]|uniref:glycoside hydrolase family 64 protein n=1 Tax=Streptomyces sp. NPDC085932 TaxID=3365741 RepID=UPI0037D46710